MCYLDYFKSHLFLSDLDDDLNVWLYQIKKIKYCIEIRVT